MVAGSLIQLADLLAQAGSGLQSRQNRQRVIVIRGGVLPQFRNLYPADNLAGMRGDAPGSLALILARRAGAGLEFLDIFAFRRYGHLKYFGQVGAGAILGLFLRGRLSATHQVLRTFILGAVAGYPVGCGWRLAGAAGEE